MDVKVIQNYILETFKGVDMIEDDGNYFYFYDRENKAPFATIVTNNKYDNYSDLDRPGVFRLNIGIGKQTFRSMFSVDRLPTESGFDFAALDTIMPHPEFGRIYWVCVLNPTESTFGEVRPMLAEAYEIAVRKYSSAQAAKRMPH